MKVLIIIEHANFGGHVQSALTTARELHRNGWEVVVASGNGTLVDTIQKEFTHFLVPYHYRHSGRQTYFTLKSRETVNRIAEIVQSESIDMIHSFDARSYIASTLMSIFKISIPVTGTLCGGITPYYNIPLSGQFIVFSKEQRDKMIQQFGWKKRNICVCSTRLDMTQFDVTESEVEELCDRYNIQASGKYIMMITTFLGPKELSIRQTLKAVQIILHDHPEYQFVLIGGKGEFFKEVQEIIAGVNKKLQRKAIILTGLIPNAFRLLKVATIVIGLGRSAFEGMAFKKPTLIVGDNGFAGTVCPDTIEDISYYNFSGRNQKTFVSEQKLANELTRLIEDADYYNEVKLFGKLFLMKKISIQSGMSIIQKVYKTNEEFNRITPKYKRVLNICRVLGPILFDNYYNQVKQIVLRKG